MKRNKTMTSFLLLCFICYDFKKIQEK